MELSQGETVTFTVADTEYFSYKIGSDALEQLYLLVQLSRKHHIELSIHERVFPDEDNNLFLVGDVAKRAIKPLFANPYMHELLCDANPFQYDREKDRIEYKDQFAWLTSEFMDPCTRDFFDGDRVEKFLCWDDELSSNHANLTKATGIYPKEDRLNVVVDAEIWKDKH